ncbi:MAG: type II toxin-antitoxin system Phd/YefM family antitoxin [Deltaproteobacteria bacterium]|nr:type II toxin-antitoxin system Phd/YefM family antitoxin [Deltaproteobacteria bacterium]
MKTLSLSEVKMKLSKLVETVGTTDQEVGTTDQEVVITKNGRPAAVLVSPDEFAGWKETNLIRSDQALMDEIKNGLSALKKKKAKLYTLEELFA